MTDKAPLSPLPEQAFDDPWHSLMGEIHAKLTEVSEELFKAKEEIPKEEEKDRSVIGSFYRLETSEDVPISSGQTILEHTFELAGESALQVFLNLSVKRDSGSTSGVPFDFDVLVNGTAFGSGSIAVNNGAFKKESIAIAVPKTVSGAISVEQTNTTLDVFLEGGGKNSIILLEIKE